MPTGRDGHRNPDIMPIPLGTNGDGEQRGALLEAMADIKLQVGRYRDEVTARDAERKRLLRQLRPMQLQPQSFTTPASGSVTLTVNVPEIMGPKDEYCWDLRSIRLGSNVSGGSFNGITVAIHRGLPSAPSGSFTADINQILQSSTAGNTFFSSGTHILMPGESLVYDTAGTSTGAALIVVLGTFIQVPLGLLGDYLL